MTVVSPASRLHVSGRTRPLKPLRTEKLFPTTDDQGREWTNAPCFCSQTGSPVDILIRVVSHLLLETDPMVITL